MDTSGRKAGCTPFSTLTLSICGRKPVLAALVCFCLLVGGCACGKDTSARLDATGMASGQSTGATRATGATGDGAGLSSGSDSPVAAKNAALPSDDAFEDYDDDTQLIADPFESWNRFWFGFNDILLLQIIKPVYTGYTYVMPQEFRSGLSNFLHNLQMPIRFINSVLQGEFAQATVEMGRFIVNSTVGMGGFIDVTKDKKVLVPINPREADFGQTLATWGVGEGFYLVLPFFGPSTARDTVGLAGDYAASPLFWAVEPVGPVDLGSAMAATVGLRFNDMGSAINTYEALTKSAVEPYIAAREAYVKYRRAGVLRDRTFW